MTHVVAAVQSYAPAVGGAQHLLAAVLESWVAHGHRATVLTFNATSVRDLKEGGANLVPTETLNGVDIVRVSPAGGWPSRLLYRLSRPRSLGGIARTLTGVDAPYWGGRPNALALGHALRHRDADVLLSVGWFSRHVPFTHAVARARGIPIVGLPLFHLERPSASWPRQRWLSQSTTALVALTSPEGVHAQAMGARDVQIIAPGLPADWAATADGPSWRAARGIANDRPLVLFVGRQVRHKGAPLLVAAMKQVWQECPQALLVLAGRARNRDAETAAAMDQLRQDERDRVLLVDDFSDEDAPSILQSASVLAMPSIQESFGLVYLQAWATGRPVIGADVSSTRSIVTHGENGLLVPPNDTSALASAILSCVHNPAYATRMGLAGQQRATAAYAVEAQHDAWRRLLERVSDTRRSP